MPLDPNARLAIEARAAAETISYELMTVEDARRQSLRLLALLGPAEPVQQIEDREIPGPLGPIPIRIYTPSGQTPFHILIYFHGGGWVLGNLDTGNVLCCQLANRIGCVIVSVNYRHAPDHQFPAATEDAYAAVQWIAEHGATFGGDPQRIVVSGQSAGGNLATVVSLMIRDRGGPRLAGQVLWAPVTNHHFDTPSYWENAQGYILTRPQMLWFWGHYLKTEADGAHPYASPLQASDLSRLPPAFVATAEFDPLRDEGNAYAERLRAAGVSVAHTCYAGMIHSYLGPQAFEDVVAFLRRAFAADYRR